MRGVICTHSLALIEIQLLKLGDVGAIFIVDSLKMGFNDKGPIQVALTIHRMSFWASGV